MKHLSLTLMAACFLAATSMKAVADNADGQTDVATFRTWAMTPPMGWNSWDCYYSSVTEKEVMQNAQVPCRQRPRAAWMGVCRG